MSKHSNKQSITPKMLRDALKGSVQKLNPRYMMKNPVMFVVEMGLFITVLLSFFPNLFGGNNDGLRGYPAEFLSVCSQSAQVHMRPQVQYQMLLLAQKSNNNASISSSLSIYQFLQINYI